MSLGSPLLAPERCAAERDGLHCVRPAGHDGRHQAQKPTQRLLYVGNETKTYEAMDVITWR